MAANTIAPLQNRSSIYLVVVIAIRYLLFFAPFPRLLRYLVLLLLLLVFLRFLLSVLFEHRRGMLSGS